LTLQGAALIGQVAPAFGQFIQFDHFGLVCVFRRKRPGVSVQTAYHFGDFAHRPHWAGGRAAS
jgi:hypothetical protein